MSSATHWVEFSWGKEKHHGNTESRKTSDKNLFFNTESMNASRSIYLFMCSYHYLSTNGIAPPTTISKQTTNNPLLALTKGECSKHQLRYRFTVEI